MKADLIFTNGQIITVDSHFTVAEALAIKGNKIIRVGTNNEMHEWKGSNTQIIDLQGRSMLPGFIDAHAHLELYGTNQLGVNCKEVHSIEEMKQKLKQIAADTPKGQWIRGWGYNQNYLSEGRHPTRKDLDEVSTEHPIIVVRTCGHISCVNSKALEMGGISDETPEPTGGRYIKEEGKPNGVLLESAHMEMFLAAQYTDEEIMQGLEIASRHFLSCGITSVHDAGAYGNEHFRNLYKAVRNGAVKLRVYTLYGSLHDSPSVLKKGVDAGVITGLGDERFRIGPAKVFIDGSSSGPTAATRFPYTSNPDDSGILYLSQEELNESLGAAHDAGWQITAHAIGDKGVEMMIECIEEALRRSPRKNHRHRIEHSGMTPPDLIKRMKSLGVIPIPNPAFIYEFGDGYVKDYGEERVESMFPAQSYIDHGIIAAIGSDSPITSFNPMVGIQAAISRKSKTGREIGRSQKIELQEAIRMYTIHGAYASYEDGIKGSLEVGKLADLVVLDRPILQAPTEELHQIEVEMTMVDGEVLYQK